MSIGNDIKLIKELRHHDPGVLLGKHKKGKVEVARCLAPDVKQVRLVDNGELMTRLNDSDIFEWQGPANSIPDRFRVAWQSSDGQEQVYYEPYCFPAQICDFDLHLFSEGKHLHAYQFLGAHAVSVNGTEGVLFATWAPNAEGIGIVGDFNHWDGRRHPMRNRGTSGIWEIFLPAIAEGVKYKFEIRTKNGGDNLIKSDPYGQRFELRPATASMVPSKEEYSWHDKDWLKSRDNFDWQHSALSVYELHLGSWQRSADGNFLNYREIADLLIPYVKEMGFTHIELLPVTEHPLDASWGYQTTGFYAPSSRFGSASEFCYFIDQCHLNRIGIILDWVAGHFPKDTHSMACFDGTTLYEHEDPRKGEHMDWGTLIFNYGRHEVKNFLISNAIFWIEEFHIDGLRVDAVASMLHLDYSRQEGEWIPNEHGGNENLEAIEFIRDLNKQILGSYPGTIMIAEESTSWPQVTRPQWLGGLGFSMKWNMGWMHDSLQYMNRDPVFRYYHHNNLTFGLLYAFHENFVLPFSHDEVVHGKGSMINKMPGDEWQQFANLRLLYTYMFTYPGKKLLFMGNEFGQWNEWDQDRSLDWGLMAIAHHKQLRSLICELNSIYVKYEELHYYDFDEQGFDWINCHDASQSVLSYIRKKKDSFLLIVLNFTPVVRNNYQLGVPRAGYYREVINSDSAFFGGSNVGNEGGVASEPLSWMDKPYSITLNLPPLAGLVIEHSGA